ncbi:hypothetical protein WQE_18179 [Paraburkholderia hospita]|uniref:Uncharacterized protein n=2 Tax=Paraburkholderia hospita TaxID=169430 RepID=A0ABP2PPC2_9BURK|nr:hypothetical protein WQE_18179 [Paraburkholderia hospita]
MQLWGKSLEFWDSVSVWLMIATAVFGAFAVATGLAGSFIGRQTSSMIQRDSDERISAAKADAAKSNAAAADAALRLEQLRRQVGPRQLQREIFLNDLRGQPSSHVEIVYLRDDPECFELAQQIWRALEDAHWPVTPPQPIRVPVGSGVDDAPTPMSIGGQPSGVTVVAHSLTEAEIEAVPNRMRGVEWVRTAFTALEQAITDSLGRGSASAGGPNAPPEGTLRVVVAPR